MEPHRLPAVGQRFFRVAAPEQGQSRAGSGGRQGGCESHRLPPVRQAIVRASGPFEGGRQGRVGVGEIGAEAHRLAAGDGRLIPAALPGQGAGQAVVGLGGVGSQEQRPPEGGLGFRGPVEVEQQPAEVGVGGGEAGFEAGGLLVTGPGLVAPPRLLEDVAEVVDGLGVGRPQRDGPAEAGLGARPVAQPRQGDAQAVVGRGEVRTQA